MKEVRAFHETPLHGLVVMPRDKRYGSVESGGRPGGRRDGLACVFGVNGVESGGRSSAMRFDDGSCGATVIGTMSR